MDRIILVGGGDQAQVVADIVQQEGRYEIAGITDTARRVGDSFSASAGVGQRVGR